MFFLSAAYLGGGLGPGAWEDGLRLSVTWEIYDFPSQRIHAAGMVGGAYWVPLSDAGLPPEVVRRSFSCGRAAQTPPGGKVSAAASAGSQLVCHWQTLTPLDPGIRLLGLLYGRAPPAPSGAFAMCALRLKNE